MTGENGTGPALQREPHLLMVDVPVTSSGIRLPIPSFAFCIASCCASAILQPGESFNPACTISLARRVIGIPRCLA
jgi:hypothetical protein